MGTRKSTTAGQHTFARVPANEQIQRSTFDRSHGNKTTLDAGDLVPVVVDEVLPGDTFAMRSHMFGRIATLLNPIMDNMFLDLHCFFVPTRLVWDNFQKFMGEQVDPGDSTDFLIPTCSAPGAGYSVGSLQDQMGIPPLVDSLEHNNLPMRAYNLIWNEWFRDQNLQDSVPVPRDDGPDAETDFVLLKRQKRHDYFTSCLPFAQKGDPVTFDLGGMAPITLDDIQVPVTPTGTGPNWQDSAATPNVTAIQMPSGSGQPVFTSIVGGGVSSFGKWSDPGLETDLDGVTGQADLSSATGITVNDFRLAVLSQHILERDARGGTRYAEVIRSQFGVISPDMRLQRPEYLGGSSMSIDTHPIANTSADGTSIQGDLSAFGTVRGSGRGWRKSFTEHGYVICLVSLRADLNYQQGLERMWSRRSRFDFYMPALAGLGEQPVYNKEIFAQGPNAIGDPDNDVFGYQEAFADYRYKPSRTSGKFRSQDPTSLDVWHLAQFYDALPLLDETFIVENPPIDRVIGVTTEPHLILDMYFEMECARPMPVYAVPGVDRL